MAQAQQEKKGEKLNKNQFFQKLKELQNEQSWLKFYTELCGVHQSDKAKTCNKRIKDLKKDLGFN